MSKQPKIATLTLNPAIDQTISIPNFEAGKVNRVKNSRSDPGGKGVNVASILADFGLPVAATGFLGKDNPHLFEQLFSSKIIEDRFVRISGSTRIGIKIIDEINQATTDINFPGQPPTATGVQSLMQIVEALTADCSWFVLSGSIPPGVSTGIYRELIEHIQSKGKKTALDTSGQAFGEALEAIPTIIKPNIDELGEFFGSTLTRRGEVLDAAYLLLDRGIETMVVSMGAEGALFAEKSKTVFARPPSITVKSTVGAGDAMLSGMIAGKTRDLPLFDCARLATAFALGAITQVGSGISSIEQIETFIETVSIEELETHFEEV